MTTITLDLDLLDFAKGNGLVTVVAQDATSGSVLMVAHADREALERCIATGEMHYRSRTRGPWHKGATSGQIQRVVSLTSDCDGDAVLARVIPSGASCHLGTLTCFGDEPREHDELSRLEQVIRQRGASAPGGLSYTQRLLHDRNLRLKKIGEEAAEFVTACADGDTGRAAEEAADLVYHMLVALHATGASLDDVRAILSTRRTAHDNS